MIDKQPNTGPHSVNRGLAGDKPIRSAEVSALLMICDEEAAAVAQFISTVHDCPTFTMTPTLQMLMSVITRTRQVIRELYRN